MVPARISDGTLIAEVPVFLAKSWGPVRQGPP